MTRRDERAAPSPAAGLLGLRANALAAIVMLCVEFELGVGVTLYARLPRSDAGRGVLPGFAGALAGGPAILTVHALVGTLLLLTGTAAVVRAARARQTRLLAIAGVAAAALIAAWLSGSGFVGDGADAASLAMALATGIALLGYALILFLTPSRPGGGQGDRGRRPA
ncbi:MAG TPA: hypothetical protein VMW47_07580 [Verrucomicrobiae bacterium]|nr:hypothetical protein [Verrucomicrobiae bacterium]